MRTVFRLFRAMATIPLAIMAMVCLTLAMPLIVILLVIVVAIEYIIDNTKGKSRLGRDKWKS